MSRRSVLSWWFLLSIAGAVQGQEWPPEIRNLQVLAKNTDARAVIDVMRGFNNALGVRCEHCHVGEPGAPLSTFDFAADTRPGKSQAREMLRMTRAINRDFLAKMDLPEGGPRVDCKTCHRSLLRPEKLKDRVAGTTLERGVVAAREELLELRREYLGRNAYDFGESSLIYAAEVVAEAGRRADAVELLRLNLEFHPEASWTLRTLGDLYEEIGELDQALATWRRVLARSPESRRAQERVRSLEAAARP